VLVLIMGGGTIIARREQAKKLRKLQPGPFNVAWLGEKSNMAGNMWRNGILVMFNNVNHVVW